MAPHRDAPVEVQVMGPGSIDVLQARNISITGIGVHVPHGFAGCDLDAEAQLVITLPGTRPFLAQGVIRHRSEDGPFGEHFGLEFTRIADANREAIARYVRDVDGP